MYRSVRPEGSLDTSAAVVPPTYKCAACLTKSQNSCGCSEPSQRCMSALALRQRASPQHARHVRMAGHEGLRAHDLCHRDCSTWEGRKVSGRAAKRSAAGPWQHEAAGSPSLTEDARDAPTWRFEGQSATARGEWRPRSAPLQELLGGLTRSICPLTTLRSLQHPSSSRERRSFAPRRCRRCVRRYPRRRR